MDRRGLFGLGVMLTLLDQFTKYLTHFYLPRMSLGNYTYPYGGVGVFSDFMGVEFSISHTINTGAAWGMLSNWQFLLILLRVVVIFLLLAYLFFWNRCPKQAIPLVLIISGALSNVFDTFIYGHVVDMLHFVFWGYDYPVFNIADSAIFLGVAWLIVLSFSKENSVKDSL